MRSVPFLCPTNAFVLFYYQLFSLRFVRFDCEFIQCWWPLFAFSLIKYIYIFRFLLTMYVHTHIYTQLWDMCNNFFFFLSLLFFFMFLFMLLLYSIHHHFIVCTVNDIWVQLLQSLNGRLFFLLLFSLFHRHSVVVRFIEKILSWFTYNIAVSINVNNCHLINSIGGPLQMT